MSATLGLHYSVVSAWGTNLVQIFRFFKLSCKIYCPMVSDIPVFYHLTAHSTVLLHNGSYSSHVRVHFCLLMCHSFVNYFGKLLHFGEWMKRYPDIFPNLIYQITIFLNNFLTEINFSKSILPPDLFRNLIYQITIFRDNFFTEISFPKFLLTNVIFTINKTIWHEPVQKNEPTIWGVRWYDTVVQSHKFVRHSVKIFTIFQIYLKFLTIYSVFPSIFHVSFVKSFIEILLNFVKIDFELIHSNVPVDT